VLITGSAAGRDESVWPQAFLVLSTSDRKGIAVLRSDDRGAGDRAAISPATTADFATDVESAVAYLKTRPEVDPRASASPP